MDVLLLRLAGPMQSWGTNSRFTRRDTGYEPSKSGVIGLLACALGRPRDASVDDLASLRLGVRVEREGRVGVDYQTAANVRESPDKSNTAKGTTTSVVSERAYLSDAEFIVALAGPRAQLEVIDAALRDPHWPMFLGRRAFVPSLPIAWPDRPDSPFGTPIQSGSLESVLGEIPYRDDPWETDLPERLRLVLEVTVSEGESIRMDQPVGSFARRHFRPRAIRTTMIPRPAIAGDKA